MLFYNAKPCDLPKWQEVADDIGGIMRVTNMGADKNFLEYAQRKLEQDNAIIAYDDINERCAGFIGFSRRNNSITWLGVKRIIINRE